MCTRALLVVLVFALLTTDVSAAPVPDLAAQLSLVVLLPDSVAALTDAQLQRALGEVRYELLFRRTIEEELNRRPSLELDSILTRFGRQQDDDFLIPLDSLLVMEQRVLQVMRVRALRPAESQFRPVSMPPQDPSGPPGWTYYGGAPSDEAMARGRSVAAIVHVSSLHQYTSKYVLDPDVFNSLRFRNVFTCADSEFYYSPVVNVAGTAFLYEEDKVITAGHVADTESFADDHRIVFGYGWMVEEPTMDQIDWSEIRLEFSYDEVYEIEDRIFWVNDGGRDATILTLKRPVVGPAPLKAESLGMLEDGEGVYAMGYPYGLPLVYTDAGPVLDNMPCNFFSCDVQIAEYNSGSPVFSNVSNEVVGIVAADYAGARVYCDCWDEGGYQVSDGRAGVLATRIGVVSDYLDHPNEALVINQYPGDLQAKRAALGAPTDGDTGPGNWFIAKESATPVPAGEKIRLWLQPDDLCVAEFEVVAGETWYIREHEPGSEKAELLRCPQDGIGPPPTSDDEDG